MSRGSDKIYSLIQAALPTYKCIREFYIPYRNTKLFFDFYLPELKLMIEVQGEQHFSFNKFFHKSANDFIAQKSRDTLKDTWCAENKHTLLIIPYKDIKSMTISRIRDLIIQTI